MHNPASEEKSKNQIRQSFYYLILYSNRWLLLCIRKFGFIKLRNKSDLNFEPPFTGFMQEDIKNQCKLILGKEQMF